MILQGVLSFQKQFQANDTDVLLVTTPKSGTTWLKALTFSMLNRNRYPPNIQSHHPLVTSSPHALVPFLELELCSDKDHLPDLNSFSPQDSSLRISLIPQCQNPGVSPSGPFWEHMLGYWKESLERPEKVMFLRFEEMKMKPCFYLKELAKFLGCPFSEEEEAQACVEDIVKLCSFDNLSNLEVNKSGKLPFGVETNVYFRRGQVGDWKNDLTDEMVEQVNSVTEKKLGELGLKFSDGTV
ncbi:Sulfotransferase domain [Sesbania bispinosa]|nr:Sulfotransferase domain [Sesbania bispinosa]